MNNKIEFFLSQITRCSEWTENKDRKAGETIQVRMIQVWWSDRFNRRSDGFIHLSDGFNRRSDGFNSLVRQVQSPVRWVQSGQWVEYLTGDSGGPGLNPSLVRCIFSLPVP